MTFVELKKLCKDKLGIDRLADIARELDVTPQVVSNWKSRDQVPYKYVKVLRKKLKKEPTANKDFSSTDQLYKQQRYINFPNYSEMDSNNFDGGDKSVLDLIKYFYNIIIKNKISFILIHFILIAIVSLNYFFYTSPVYVSTAKILPTAGGGQTGVTGLAQQFGINIGGKNTAQPNSLSSSEMFPDVIKSRRLAMSLLDKTFLTKKFGQERPLINIILKNKDKKNWSPRHRKKATSKLLKRIKVKSSKKTALIVIQVFTSEAQFSADLSNAVINQLQELISSFRLSQVRDKKKFIEDRMKEVQKELTVAEDNLKIFRDQNRKILASPSLLLEEARLIREVEVQTQIYITLKTENEMAQIEEVERSGLLQVLDFPEAPTRRISPASFVVILFVTILFSFVIGLLMLAGVDYYKSTLKKNLSIN